MRRKTLTGCILAVTLSVCTAGCTETASVKQETQTDERQRVTIGNWPGEEAVSRRGVYEKMLQKVRKMNPDIDFVTDDYSYDVATFSQKAENNQLPTVYDTWFTEISNIVDMGYAADITDEMYERGYAQSMNPDLLGLVSDDDGRIYAVPCDAYAQGLAINKEIFSQLGLNPPDTWTELAEVAKRIKERTGKPGFAMPSKVNSGGWLFLNIAWSYGAVFLDKLDGRWTAMFDTPECVAALQYVKDLRWKYDVLPDDPLIDGKQMEEMFAAGELGMCINNLAESTVDGTIGPFVGNMQMVSIPRGPKGRYSQMGGNVHMISKNATKEQISAVFDWFEIMGETPKINNDILENIENKLKERIENGRTVLYHEPFSIWVNVDRTDKIEEIRNKYTNVNKKDFRDYYEFEGVIINAEPAVATQSLYHILDGCIQQVLTDKDADCAELISKAAMDYQNNYLDQYN